MTSQIHPNFGLYKALDELGIEYAKTPVGDKYVYEYMAKNSCRIGGEQSGHIIFSKYATTGDGILTSLKMMEVMLARKKELSELAAPFKVYPQVLENVRVSDKEAAQSDPDVQAAVTKVAEALGDTGRISIIYTLSTFAQFSFVHLQETGRLQAVYPHKNERCNLQSCRFSSL